MRYSKKDAKFLIDNYSNAPKNKIIKKLNRTWDAIQGQCFKLGLKRGFNQSKHSFKLKKLLKFSNVSCYWLGFILADGHIDAEYKININLAIKDLKHLQKLKKYLGDSMTIYPYTSMVRAKIFDHVTIKKLTEIFKWEQNKTKNPPVLPNLKEDQLFSLIIGFIDGDGTISKRSGIKVTCDSSWYNILEKFYEHLTKNKKFFKPYTYNYGDKKISIKSRFYISKHDDVKNIKLKALNLKLPILKRKWDRINLNRVLKKDKYKIGYNLLSKKKTIEEIIKITGYSKSLIYNLIAYQKVKKLKTNI